MLSPFLSKEYVAIALIKTKYEIFNEAFITLSELNQFNQFVQQELNNQDLGIVITSNDLSRENFNITNGIVMPAESCWCNLDRLPANIYSILNDKNLVSNFLMKLEIEKLKTLKNVQLEQDTPAVKESTGSQFSKQFKKLP